MLDLVDVAAAYHAGGRAQVVFQDINLRVQKGEILALLGPSGCGKSTLLRLIAGLAAPHAGRIELATGGEPARVRVVFQEPHLLPWLTVTENVELGLRYRVNHGSGRDHVPAVLAELGIAELSGNRVDQLSGGQAQRVSLARAIVTRPQLLLLDEPFASLDPVTRSGLQTWLTQIRDALDLTMVFVTHDVDEALAVGDRIAVMQRGGHGFAGLWSAAAVGRSDLLAAYGADPSPSSPRTPTPHPQLVEGGRR